MFIHTVRIRLVYNHIHSYTVRLSYVISHVFRDLVDISYHYRRYTPLNNHQAIYTLQIFETVNEAKDLLV